MEESEFFGSFEKRTKYHKRNEDLDNLIQELSDFLSPVQKSINTAHQILKFPYGLVVGAPRSGTTFLTQWLSSLGCFSYPTNVLARFSYASTIGVMIEKMLYDKKYSYQNDLGDYSRKNEYLSFLGKSKGPMEPNEFFHFWRKFIPSQDLQFIEKDKWENADFKSMRNELAIIEKWTEKPFVCKGMFIQYNLVDFQKEFPNSIYFHIKRDPIDVMQSIYRSRLEMYKDVDVWWSVKPKEYGQLRSMDVYHQIAGQVFYTNKSIEKEFISLNEDHKLTIDYSRLCKEPASIYEDIKKKYAAFDFNLPSQYSGPESFSTSAKKGISQNEIDRLKSSYNHFLNKYS